MVNISVIVPVFNRPAELDELLESIAVQKKLPYEIIVVEDGSTERCNEVVAKFSDRLPLKYFYKENEGQGFARNYGFEKSTGEFLIVFDSDCILAPDYFDVLTNFLVLNKIDAFGGPDRARDDFTVIQKAINHSMTSFLTTGGIRGRKKKVGQYHPRSFNMGFSRQVYNAIGGYRIPFMGEDIEFSTRILKAGYQVAFLEEAFVYHKRRTDFSRFFKQLKYFGRARINVSRFHPDQVKLIHLFPLIFSLGLIFALLLWLVGIYHLLVLYLVYFGLIFLEALVKTGNLKVGLLAPVAAFLQLTGYGYGLAYEFFRKLAGRDPNAKYIDLY
jgi:glycosyltransferase involved in cell wall biosynthesis